MSTCATIAPRTAPAPSNSGAALDSTWMTPPVARSRCRARRRALRARCASARCIGSSVDRQGCAVADEAVPHRGQVAEDGRRVVTLGHAEHLREPPADRDRAALGIVRDRDAHRQQVQHGLQFLALARDRLGGVAPLGDVHEPHRHAVAEPRRHVEERALLAVDVVAHFRAVRLARLHHADVRLEQSVGRAVRGKRLEQRAAAERLRRERRMSRSAAGLAYSHTKSTIAPASSRIASRITKPTSEFSCATRNRSSAARSTRAVRARSIDSHSRSRHQRDRLHLVARPARAARACARSRRRPRGRP